MLPTIGRIVHYHDNLNKTGPHAAIVTLVTTGNLMSNQRVNLQIFWRDGGTSNAYDIPFVDSDGAISEAQELPYAIWPPRV